jgi:hypothetical protein
MKNNYWLDKWQKNDTAFHEENVTADLIAYINELKLKPGDCIEENNFLCTIPTIAIHFFCKSK